MKEGWGVGSFGVEELWKLWRLLCGGAGNVVIKSGGNVG